MVTGEGGNIILNSDASHRFRKAHRLGRGVCDKAKVGLGNLWAFLNLWDEPTWCLAFAGCDTRA